MRPSPPITSLRRPSGFTLIEMLVVIAIIGLIAVAGLPALKGFGKSNSIAGAQRQMLDELNSARQRAIAEHTDVYMLFACPTMKTNFIWAQTGPALTPAQLQQVSNVLKQQYTGYALYVRRSVGDQPGQANGRYLTKWRSLPDGIFIRTTKFDFNNTNYTAANDSVSPFYTNYFPFPAVSNKSLVMPYLQFNHLGQLVSPQGVVSARDNGTEIIPLAQGFVEYGNLSDPLNVTLTQETPPGNSSSTNTMMNRIRIDALTGRARVEHFVVR